MTIQHDGKCQIDAHSISETMLTFDTPHSTVSHMFRENLIDDITVHYEHEGGVRYSLLGIWQQKNPKGGPVNTMNLGTVPGRDIPDWCLEVT